MPRRSEIQSITATTIWMAVEPHGPFPTRTARPTTMRIMPAKKMKGWFSTSFGINSVNACFRTDKIAPRIIKYSPNYFGKVVGKCIYDFILRKIAELDEFDYP